MKFGICCSDDLISVASSAGYDYVELAVSGSLKPETENERHILELKELLTTNNITCETMNMMLSPGLRCVSVGVDTERLEKYFAVAIRRAAEIGAKVLVFGSGGQRNVPNSLSHSEGYQQFTDAVKMAGKNAAKHEIVIAIEPLNRSESNLINSVAEGIKLVDEIGYPSVRVLSDLYHVQVETQLFAETTAAGAKLAHVHVAGKGRRAPIGEDIPILAEYFKAVKAAGYDSRVSVEANWQDVAAQGGEALNTMREAWSLA
jgi:D-psicose/D-tagatose/L-ribulose 3-epimerase